MKNLPDSGIATVVRSEPLDAARGRAAPGAFYLLVFEGESSTLFRLPAGGEAVIGRAESADLCLRDGAISRFHARVTVRGAEVELTDLESRNGTFVNGARLTGARSLVSGDSITICGATLVFQGTAPARPSRAPLNLSELRERLVDELERSLGCGRPLTVAALLAGNDREAGWAERVMQAARRMDLVARDGRSQVYVLLPEVSAEAAPELLDRILAACASDPDVRAGFASCPGDGCDAETLLSGARSAALAASDGRLATLANSVRTLRIGQTEVLIADPSMAKLYALIDRLARVDLPVLISGETGTGKELAALALHQGSPRAGKPLVALNCAAFQENLIESELFGHERGAFSGASTAKPGLIETAEGGTLFLDEVGELSLPVQAKLLRALDTRRLTRVGDVRERAVDFRLVAATNRDLQRLVGEGRFRQDLYYRLNAARLWLPPLRDRAQELPVLASAFLAAACTRLQREPLTLSAAAMRVLHHHPWPGNVRELKNAMEYLAASVSEAVVEPGALEGYLESPGEPALGDRQPAAAQPLGAAAEVAPRGSSPSPTSGRGFRSLEEEVRALERARIGAALEAAGGNKTQAAKLIHMPLRTFLTKVKRHALAVNDPKREELP